MTKKSVSVSLCLILFSTVIGRADRGRGRDPFHRNLILLTTRQVADWQLENPHKTPLGDWVQGPFLNGLLAIGKLPGNENYADAVKAMGQDLKWGVISTHWKANDHCTPQSWLECYETDRDPAMLTPTRAALDTVMEITSKQDGDLRFMGKNRFKWSWCDALYMSPPTFARLAVVTGEQRYRDYLHQSWWACSDFYYDQEEHLYFRDQHYFNRKEPNGEKVFWSRGNGWVMGGLVRVLQYLPKDDPIRPRYEQQLREMCDKLAEIQCADGLWRSGLLDPNSHPKAETSGSSFFVYALAYAVNEGIIDRQTFVPVLARAWPELCRYVKPDGRFVGVQPIGDAPKQYDDNYTMPYGVGAFLLAASEIYRAADLFVTSAVVPGISPVPTLDKPISLSKMFRRMSAPGTGRKVVQLTSGPASAYPMYYFIPSITKEGKYLVYHRYKDKEVQLWRLSLIEGETLPMTRCTAQHADWRRWQTEPGLTGVSDFRSAVNVARGTVLYFDGNTAHSMDIETLQSKELFTLPADREAQGQNCCSPDGQWFVYIDRPLGSDFRKPCEDARVVAYHLDTREQRVLCSVDHAIHHVTLIDNEHFMAHHPPQHNGMCFTDLTSGRWIDLRYGDPHVQGFPCHSMATARGLAYEVRNVPGLTGGLSGLYDPFTRRRFEFALPASFGYTHTGWDPTARLWFYETCHTQAGHSMWYLEKVDPQTGAVYRPLLGEWPCYGEAQRGHFHPQVTPDHRWIMFSAGDTRDHTTQIFLLDIADLPDTQGIIPKLMTWMGEFDVKVPGRIVGI